MARPVKHRGRAAAAGSPTPDTVAKLTELLAAPPESDIVSQLVALGAETTGGPLALIEALGASHDEAAGRIVAALAVGAPDKEQRKAARRALHKLRSSGMAVTIPVAAHSEPPAATAQETLHPVLSLVTAPDGVGSRLLWLLMERPRGGLVAFHLAINDVVGLKDVMIDDTTRRRFERYLAEWTERSARAPTEIPVEYGLSLLSEGLALNAESHFPLPRDFVLRRPLLGELPPPPTAPLIHQHVSRGQIFLLPTLLEESGRLLEGEPELMGWLFSHGEIERFAREYRQTDESRLLMTSEPRETRIERIVTSAVDTLFTPEIRRGMRRRLEETAYIFWQTGRERSARQAVAAAFAIGDAGSLRTHPLLRQIVLKSIELANEIDRSGIPLPPGANRTARDPI
jgi:hypothetical protein